MHVRQCITMLSPEIVTYICQYATYSTMQSLLRMPIIQHIFSQSNHIMNYDIMNYDITHMHKHSLFHFNIVFDGIAFCIKKFKTIMPPHFQFIKKHAKSIVLILIHRFTSEYMLFDYIDPFSGIDSDNYYKMIDIVDKYSPEKIVSHTRYTGCELPSRVKFLILYKQNNIVITDTKIAKLLILKCSNVTIRAKVTGEIIIKRSDNIHFYDPHLCNKHNMSVPQNLLYIILVCSHNCSFGNAACCRTYVSHDIFKYE